MNSLAAKNRIIPETYTTALENGSISHEFREYWRVKALKVTIYLCVPYSVRGMKYETEEREPSQFSQENSTSTLLCCEATFKNFISSASYIYRKGEQAPIYKFLKLIFLPDQFLGRKVAFLNIPLNIFPLEEIHTVYTHTHTHTHTHTEWAG